MNFEKINKAYTEKVMEWMTKGYGINAGTMRGSQGEIARIDLTNGKEIIRIYIDKDYVNYDDISYHHCYVTKIVVGKINNIKPYVNNGGMIIWNDKLSVIDETIFYEICRGSNWYGTREEFEVASAKRSKRYENKKPS